MSFSAWQRQIKTFGVYPGIILGYSETIQNEVYLRKIGVTYVLNIAELHVSVNPDKYLLHGKEYLKGFTGTWRSAVFRTCVTPIFLKYSTFWIVSPLPRMMPG